MNVRCESCDTVYRVDPEQLPVRGVRARCTVCSHVISIAGPSFASISDAANARAFSPGTQGRVANALGDAFIPPPEESGQQVVAETPDTLDHVPVPDDADFPSLDVETAPPPAPSVGTGTTDFDEIESGPEEEEDVRPKEAPRPAEPVLHAPEVQRPPPPTRIPEPATRAPEPVPAETRDRSEKADFPPPIPEAQKAARTIPPAPEPLPRPAEQPSDKTPDRRPVPSVKPPWDEVAAHPVRSAPPPTSHVTPVAPEPARHAPAHRGAGQTNKSGRPFAGAGQGGGPTLSAPSAPSGAPKQRLSRPFSVPRATSGAVAPGPAGAGPMLEPSAAPSRPAAPVFKPTPGQPVQPPPTPPREAQRQVAPPLAEAKPTPLPPAAERSAPPPPAVREPTGRPVNPFLSRDPRQKARRLARALISDMIVYQPEKRQRAMRDGTLKEAFDEEIRKSWLEFVEQVGQEIAESTTHFNDALNDILAGGQKVF